MIDSALRRTPPRRAFTLIELLIVIACIATLAGLLIPATGMVRQQMRTIQCSNNLRQIATGLEAYRQDHRDEFPNLAIDLIRTHAMPGKIYICPFDSQKGTEPNMGRNPTWSSYTKLHEAGSSYCFECSSNPGKFSTGPYDGRPNSDQAYFYRDLSEQEYAALTEDKLTWSAAKQHQQLSGNLKPGRVISDGVQSSDFGAPFPATSLPIIRCYWHANWLTENAMSKKVNNVSLAFNVLWTSTYWEVDVNPALAPPR